MNKSFDILTIKLPNLGIKYIQEVKCEEQCGLLQACCCQCKLPLMKQRIGALDISLSANVDASHHEENTLAS